MSEQVRTNPGVGNEMGEGSNSQPPPGEDEDSQPQLNVGVSQFVESMGMLMERYGVPRIGGRIMGLLMLDDKPLSLDDIAGLLSVSRASVSTNLRMTEMSGMAVKVSRPGDRRDYYVGVEDVWARGLKTSKSDAMVVMREAARKALPNIPLEENVARARLQEIIDFCDFFTERLEELMQDWQEYKTKRDYSLAGNKFPA